MIVARPESFRSNRRAYMLIELVVASFLTVQIGMVLVLTWKAFGVSALQVEERASLTVNANLAAESFTRDWADIRSGQRPCRRPMIRPRSIVSTNSCLLGLARPTPTTPIHCGWSFQSKWIRPRQRSRSYNTIRDGQLMRYDETRELRPQSRPMSRISKSDPVLHDGRIPRHVSGSVSPLERNEFIISFTVSYRDFTGTYTLNMQYPP